MVREYGEMNVVIEEGLLLQHIYVLASGTVEVMNSKKGLKRAFGHRRIGSVNAPNVFGFDEAILGNPAEFTFHASTECTLLLIPKEQIIALFAKSPIFANNISCRILQTLSSFSIFQDFCRCIFGRSSASTNGNVNGYHLSIPALVSLYKSTDTLFHRLVNEHDVDSEALRYCTRRLPANVTSTHVFVLTSFIPDFISNEFLADATINGNRQYSSTEAVDTGRRRRCAWTFGGGGQTLVMMRDGFTDTIDFVSNLCMYTIEARKIRTRLRQLVSPTAVEIIRDGLVDGNRSIQSIFEKLPFSPEEVEALCNAWHNDVLAELYNILLHREEYIVHLEASNEIRFSQDAYANWSLTLQRHIKESLGIEEMCDLPEDVAIDVIFSPNRTFKNLFCSMASECKEFVEAFETRHPNMGDGKTALWKNQEDRYYYILTGLLERESTFRDAYRARLESNGFMLFEDAHSSALIVDLVDVSKLRVEDVDSDLQEMLRKAKKATPCAKRFIINIDKTFGSQIEAVLRSILLTFGNRVRSVNITGKAAGLIGNRGDVVLPSKLLFSKQSFGEDSTDEIRLCNRNSMTVEDMHFIDKSCHAKVHSGTLITVPGFIFQSRPILTFYKIVHGCTALDMQSSYIARQIEECRRTGVVTTNVTSRYVFFCDDMPLGTDDGSILTSKKREIISTIYATARSLFTRVLDTRVEHCA
ncbi:cyclic nucleotide-binding protein [Strigomonas culicis]|uniref:Cyclic nucleotide-binding protein n=1 Tax=Strigomonas culicis TaxID=28005 RepID=S9V4S3_9TRYP|nr:cyclic nucleotide-binding protein [Strigomonas culicis]|eukprot:EPY36039.1 cyclic nucleotide-binding protein [Strigomonas culicis]